MSYMPCHQYCLNMCIFVGQGVAPAWQMTNQLFGTDVITGNSGLETQNKTACLCLHWCAYACALNKVVLHPWGITQGLMAQELGTL